MRNSSRVLVIEDDEHIREIIAQVLHRSTGMIIDTADTLEEAIQLWESYRPDYQAVILDLNLAGEQGEQLARRFLLDRPELGVIVTTGHTQETVNQRLGELSERVHLLLKPFTLNELKGVVLGAIRTG